MDAEREDYADPATGRSRTWPRGVVLLLAATAIFGVGLAGAIAFYIIRDHFAG